MTKQQFSNTALLKIYEKMLLLRRFEEKVGQLYGMGLIGGFCHLYIGQEAVALGISEAVEKRDKIITSYRDHGIMLAIGSDPNMIMAELLGKETGYSKGKGGSMHIFDKERNFFGGHGIVGAQVSLGTGMGFASKYNDDGAVSLTMFGDGAVNQGQVYECFNMAKLWNLPVLYIIENNEYSMGTSLARSSCTTDLYKRGASFDIEGEQVDGMDFFAVHKAVVAALERIRNGSGPLIIEMKTYRYRGHSVSDPAKYRDKEEVDQYKQIDCIQHLKSYMQDTLKVADIQLKKVANDVKKVVEESVDFAQNSEEPKEEELYTDVLCS
mgnify:CR=1 FL=1